MVGAVGKISAFRSVKISESGTQISLRLYAEVHRQLRINNPHNFNAGYIRRAK